MKLIDLLVQELPKRGGWPDGAEIAVQDADSQICFSSHGDVYANKCQTDWYGGDWGDGYWSNPFIDTIADDRHECIVTRKQYESALSASKKPTWSGEGLPPVGCECEIKYKCHDDDAYWERVVILWQRGDDTLVEYIGDHFKNTTQLIHKTSMHVDFRPLRTEAERKRDIAVKVIKGLLMFDYGDDPRVNDATFIYDAIAAGKIPGVKLDG